MYARVHSVEEDEIEDRCDKLRKELLAESDRNSQRRGGGGGGPSQPRKGLKMHQVHELAEAKIKESERLRRALKISKDYEEGGHWKRQEERLQKSLDKNSTSQARDDRD